MIIINVTCGEIQTPVGFLYVILPGILNQTLRGDCDQSWYLQDGHLIAVPANPQKLIAPVISVSSDRLVTSLCVNLNHEIICDSADGFHFSRVTAFRARNQTAATPNPDDLNESLQHSDQLWWLFALLIIVILMCFLLRKRIFSCFRSVVLSICQRTDSGIRDPESGVQMSFRSDEPLSLNESESEQINSSMFRG